MRISDWSSDVCSSDLGRGFDAITYDYRGIGDSRPPRLKGCGYRWREWGTQDFAAVLDAAEQRAGGRPVMVVGHSIGGFLPALAPSLERCSAVLTVGAQYAYCPDYASSARLRPLFIFPFLFVFPSFRDFFFLYFFFFFFSF